VIKFQVLLLFTSIFLWSCGGGGGDEDAGVGVIEGSNNEPTASTNTMPVALAGSDQAIANDDQFYLDGGDSYALDGGQLEYTWTFEQAPAGTSALL
jgi:hypothetical protein